MYWSYSFTRDGRSCSTGPVTISVKITYNLPAWDPPDSAPLSLTSQWASFYNALERHEKGHGEFGKQAGYDILERFETLGEYSSCQELERVTDALGEDILNQYRAKEFLYDQETNHGEAEGVKFP